MKLNVLVVLGVMTLLNVKTNVYAKGDSVGNGGDTCEARIQSIARNIQEWILYDNHSSLDFKDKVSKDEYEFSMLTALKLGRVSCTDENLFVGKAEKTCKNYPDENFIECNIEKFMKTDDEGQYRLIHHEFAGLAGIEVNNGDEASDYFLSNQISRKLEWETVQRLPINSSKNSCYIFLKRNSLHTTGDIKGDLTKIIREDIISKGYNLVMEEKSATYVLEYSNIHKPDLKNDIRTIDSYILFGSRLVMSKNGKEIYNQLYSGPDIGIHYIKSRDREKIVKVNLEGILPCR